MAENLAHLISTSLGFGVVIALLLLLRRVLDGRFAPTWWRQVWTWLLVVMFLYLPAQSFLTAVIPSLIEVDTPQAVVDGAYDRYNAFLWDDEKIVAAGGGGAGGAMTMTEDGNMWYRHYVNYEDAQGQDVTIRDNDYLRSVTVDGTTTYTVHWTGVVYLVYTVVAALLFIGGLVRYGLFRRRCLRWSTPAGTEDLAALEEQKQALGLEREVELYRCSLVHTPLLMGFLHPVILLPDGMPQGSLATALAHELTHLKSRDTAQLLWASSARAIHWFNPMVWLLVRQLHREMELCCDYNLLKDRDAAGRRAYGQAILDQMTAGDRGLSRLTTGFSGDKKEVFARFKAMMDTSPKRRGRIAMAAALVVVALAGSLVGCQTGASTPEGDGAWIAGIDLEARTVTYYPLSQGIIDDQEALSEWIWGEDGMAAEEPRTVSLSDDVQFRHTYEGETYSIPATTIQFSVSMTQAGTLGEVEVDGNEAVRVQLASTAYLDLAAADLDFTGYCGAVYAVGMGGVRFQDGTENLSVDPCTETGADTDHTYYTLPLAPDAAISEEDLPFLTGLSSAAYPNYWKLTVVNGAVTAVEAMGEAAEGEPEATFTQAYEHYNEAEGALSGFTVSQAVQKGQSCDEFYHEKQDVTLWVFPSGKGGPYPAEVLYGGQSLSLELPIHPLASYTYGNAAGTATLCLADLTGDGTPELVYIWGMGGTGVWESHCTVLDLVSMEELPVVLDFDALTAKMKLTLAEQREEQLIFQVTGPDGQSHLAAKDWHYPEAEVSEEIAADFYYNIYLSDSHLMLEAAFDPDMSPLPSGAPLGTLTVSLDYDPASGSFQNWADPEVHLYQPVEETP